MCKGYANHTFTTTGNEFFSGETYGIEIAISKDYANHEAEKPKGEHDDSPAISPDPQA